MIEKGIYKEYSYSGKLARYCEGFINEKRAIGFIYNSEAKLLSQFSRFTLDYNVKEDELSEKLGVEILTTTSDGACFVRTLLGI